MSKDEEPMNQVLHDDYQFTMQASGNVLSKQDAIKWALSDDINRDKVRIVYENDEIGVSIPLLLLVRVIFRLLWQY